MTQDVRLTETVQKGGCAAKLPAGQLRAVLAALARPAPPELLVGAETLDDAALWDLGDGRCLVQTLDFFTPIVDEPRAFGAIAAANSVSDVYAMGGRPATAMTILAFPTAALALPVLQDVMAGALEVLERAGVTLVGGHSIDDETLKLGFSVTGFVPRSRAWTNAGAKPGDALLLTKPLGTGTIASALKRKLAPAEWIDAAVRSMTTLNDAPPLLRDVVVHAATDVTGFGLAGHALQMGRASGASLRIALDALPALPGALEALRDGIVNRAHTTNGEYVADVTPFPPGVDPVRRLLALDPQTSGGLLLAVPRSQAANALARLRGRFPATVRIGDVVDGAAGVQFV